MGSGTSIPETGAEDALESGPGLNAEHVGAYLRAHPDFLREHPDVLDALAPPERGDGGAVVDLQSVMLQRRRGEIEDLKDCARTIIETTRNNMSTQSRTHAAVLGLLAAENFEELLRVVSDDLPMLLQVDVCMLNFELHAPPPAVLTNAGARMLPPGAVDALIEEARTTRLISEITDDGTLFGAGAGVVRSAALARIDPGYGQPPGLLCLGAREPLFHANQGTELLAFLTGVVEHCASRWMTQGAD
ncbi:MAG: DUF484 family protein [Rhodospirillales bacterium]